METSNSSILGVLSGKDSIKIGVDLNTIVLLSVCLFVAVLGAVIIARKVS